MSDLWLRVDPEEEVECANCDWSGVGSDLQIIVDAHDRLDPGDILPAGECPQCGALVHLKNTPQSVRFDFCGSTEERNVSIVRATDALHIGFPWVYPGALGAIDLFYSTSENASPDDPVAFAIVSFENSECTPKVSVQYDGNGEIVRILVDEELAGRVEVEPQ